MKTQTRIGLAVGLILALLGGLAPRAGAVSATGGNYTNDIPGYRIHVFTNNATASNFVVSADGGGNVQVLVVAGGGAGGRYFSGGGGAGGVVYSNAYPVVAGSNYTVIVGSGGVAGTVSSGCAGGDGSNSMFGAITAYGGGGGNGSNAGGVAGRPGGCGGGAGGTGTASGGAGSQGGNGGTNTSANGGSGGGGAGAPGANFAGSGGKGGDGLVSSISGPSVTYAGGGGGSHGTPGGGGAGGGGKGADNSVAAANGTPNTGGGGGGGSQPQTAGAGGSGIVIVRYAVPNVWNYSMPITFTNDARLNTLTNFPALVIFDTNKVNYGQFQANGQDLRFMDGNGAELRYEVESWMSTNSATSNSYIWVQIPTLTAGCSITAYWGNASAALPSYRTNGTAWAGYAGVWHLKETSTATRMDSTANTNNASRSGSTTGTSGEIGDANYFEKATSDYLNCGTNASLAGKVGTISAWIKAQITQNTNARIFEKGSTSYRIGFFINANVELYSASPALDLASGALNDNAWHYVVGTWGTAGAVLYVDGAQYTSTTGDKTITSMPANPTTYIGEYVGGGSFYFNGAIDEVRNCDSVLSANWIWAEWCNMASNAAFNTYGTVSSPVPATSPQIQNRIATGVTTNGATFNGYLLTNGISDASVYVLWGGTNGTVSLPWAYTNWWAAGAWTNGSYPATNLTLEADREYFYRFGATNSTTNVMATVPQSYQYLITARLTPTTTDGLCGPAYSDTATIAISRPASLTNDALVVNYALSGSGTNYVSASPASGFTLAAGEASRNIVFTPVAWNTNAVATVTLTLLPGPYASNDLGSAQVSVTNATTLTAASDTSIGSAMNVLENPPATVTPTGAGPYTYGFSGLTLNLNGKKIYYNTAQRDVVLTNLAGVADSGAGSIDTSSSGNNNNTGYIEIYSSGAVQVGANLTTRCAGNYTTGRIVVNATDIRVGGGVTTDNIGNGVSAGSVTLNAPGGSIGITNVVATYNHQVGGVASYAGAVTMNAGSIWIGGAAGGYAIDASGFYPESGMPVTLTATNGVTLATGGIATYGKGGGAVTISGGAAGSAGDVYIGGNIRSYTVTSANSPGAIAITGANIRVTGYVDADQNAGSVVAPIAVQGSGSVRVDGHVTASRAGGTGGMTGANNVGIQGASVTVGGTNASGYSVLAMNAINNVGSYAGNISLIATNGDITVAGGYDAYSAYNSATYNGYVTNIASGNITIGSLNASRFKAITLMAGQTGTNWIYVTGVITNFTTNASPNRINFPAGSVISNNIYYHPVNNGAGLSGEYAIYVGTDTGKKLLAGPPGAGGNPPIVVNGAATNQTATTAALIGTMASTGTAASVAYVFWSTTDCTNNEAAWLSTGGGVSNLGPRVQGESFTNTVSGLSANTRYYYNFMGSNSVGKGWAATNASPSFWTDGQPGVGTNVGATAIGAFSATLNGSLSNCVLARVFVYYGTDYNNWAFTNDLGWRGTGTFSTAASGLSMNTLCYYQCRATNIYGSALSAVAGFTTLSPTTNTMSGDVLIGDPLAGINAAGTAPYTYDFGAYRTLDMGGYKLYRNDQQRDVRVTNVLAILNGGSVDTSRSGNLDTGYIELYASGPVAFTNNLTTRNAGNALTGRILVNATDIRIGGGVLTDNSGIGKNAGSVTLTATAGNVALTNCITTCSLGSGSDSYAGAVIANAARISIGGTNSFGFAIDAHGNGGGNHMHGNSVTLIATNGITLGTGGIGTYGHGGGDVSISDGAGGSAGAVYIGGAIQSSCDEGGYRVGAITVRGGSIRITGNLNADYFGGGTAAYLSPILIAGSGAVRLDGYVSASHPSGGGNIGGNHSVTITGSSVTLHGQSSGGYSVLANLLLDGSGSDYGGNISLVATAGDVSVAGGFDALDDTATANSGTVTNLASGNITIGSLDASRFKAITLMAGQGGGNWIYVTGVLTNFTKTESPKRFTFPSGSMISNDVYYLAASNTAAGLTGTYDIYAGAANTGMKLRDGEPWGRGTVFKFR